MQAQKLQPAPNSTCDLEVDRVLESVRDRGPVYRVRDKLVELLGVGIFRLDVNLDADVGEAHFAPDVRNKRGQTMAQK